MVRRRKGKRGLPSGGEDEEFLRDGAASPVHVRRPSPEYTPMQRPLRGRSPVGIKDEGDSDSSSSSGDSHGDHKKHKKHRKKRKKRSGSVSSSASDASRDSRLLKKKSRKNKQKKSRKKRHKEGGPLVPATAASAAAAAAYAAAARVGGGPGAPPSSASTSGGGERDDEPIVIFDRVSRAFTSDVQHPKEANPLGGALSNSEGHARNIRNYRKAFGLALGDYSFVSDGNPLPPATAAAVSAAAAQAAAGGGPTVGALLTLNKGAEGGASDTARDTRINPKSHPHLYWSCWRCSALNYKTRHQCYKCNRLYQR